MMKDSNSDISAERVELLVRFMLEVYSSSRINGSRLITKMQLKINVMLKKIRKLMNNIKITDNLIKSDICW